MLYYKGVYKISNKLKKIKLTSTNGDIHFINKEDCCLSNWLIEDKEVDEIEAKKVSKLEALKPLLLDHI